MAGKNPPADTQIVDPAHNRAAVKYGQTNLILNLKQDRDLP